MKVLIVDDRPDNLYLLRQLLESRGFGVDEAVNGREALTKLNQQKFDLVISDIMMPEMDGFELCHLVKTSDALRQIPFVVYTATYTSSKDEALARSLGASGFLVKPTEPHDFLRQIEDIISKAEKGEALPHQPPAEEQTFLRQYNERLIHKLEDKSLELEQKNAALEELTRTLEQRVRAAVKDLEERNRELEAFASSVSHDLRRPLRGIAGRAAILMEEAGATLNPEHREHVERIINTAQEMDGLIDSLLSYSRLSMEEIALRPISLESAVQRAAEQISARMEENKAQLNIHRPLPSVRAHEPVLVQVFANLLDNAIKFTEPDRPPCIEVSASEASGRVTVVVRDNGIGIAPEFRERIFEMFQRLSGASPGHGIGLAIVRKAVERMGGTVTVESKPGEGSSFILNFARG